jgi:hypothetical protein
MAERGQIDTDVRQRMVTRMGDISVFMQEFKQRFSRWYNRHHQRDGTLWSERFRSVLLEDQPATVEAVAAYIDLNPVRAGIVADPKDYRFCGYAAAVAGNKLARQGLMSIQNGAYPGELTALNHARTDAYSPAQASAEVLAREGVDAVARAATQAAPIKAVPHLATRGTPAPSIKPWTAWSVCASEYRMHLFARAGTTHQSGKTTLNPEHIREVMQQGGELSLGEMCRLRLRHFTDGLALGTQQFVNEVFALHRDKFSPKRHSGALPLRPFTSMGLSTLRHLRRRAIG